MADRERCPTCGQPIGAWVPARVCYLCHRPIRKGHKWRIDKSRIRHRICDDPQAYEPKAVSSPAPAGEPTQEPKP